MLDLPPNEVHVWQAVLPATPLRMARLARTLSADERERGQRFYFERDRESYVAARGTLRVLLADYIGMPPAEIRFTTTVYGKPELANPPAPIQFNISHSHGVGLFAFAMSRRVGVDVERVKPDFAGKQIAERFFSPAEVAMLRSLPPEEQTDAFFRCWTRKEAFVKARGEGLSLPLDRFDVDLTPNATSALVATRPDAEEVGRWLLRDLSQPPPYFAALAAEGREWTVRRFTVRPDQSECEK